ncbi:hypothetical protein ABIB85_007455 [Bradyrhizobium sp. JR1.5]|uniref:hypothetical protein n=1 Tax=unclassified Bradyrhizobium TaxID=2631580 RepID=UPI0033991CFA
MPVDFHESSKFRELDGSIFIGGHCDGKPIVFREAFRGFFAFYAAKAHQDHNHDGEHLY